MDGYFIVCDINTYSNVKVGKFYKSILISVSKFNLPPSLPEPRPVGGGNYCGSQTYFFDHTRTWRASPDE